MGGPFLVRHSYEGPNWDYPHKKFLKMVKYLVKQKFSFKYKWTSKITDQVHQKTKVK